MVDPLIASGTNESLHLAAKIASHCGMNRFPRPKWVEFLWACARLYPTNPRERERVIGSRYFIRVLVRDFESYG
ncbi:hypothetical protein [Paracoccus benzoatiresistens]|uniref:Uncharacterized protein n=1 Tax=Paracoccus benzoatiresistens TaxID=2997341 RepID=A0ABT4J7G3_9RHOB|nr:hypothetical protein [Paracoccus sp. EF6]MCZ0963067.1 hypothetical protein [Paracoccus sp. EF6]